MSAITVLAPGMLTTVQARARHGLAHLGITPGGPADELSFRVANLLVGNDDDAAALEITLIGPRLSSSADALVSLCGADLSATVDGVALPPWRPVWWRAGATLAFGKPRHGARAYLAVAGGFDVEPVLGSRATHLPGGFGGIEGRALRAGDVLACRTRSRRRAPLTAAIEPLPFVAAWARDHELTRIPTLRVIAGSAASLLDAPSKTAFVASSFAVERRSDRMGVRCAGSVLGLTRHDELITAPVTEGTVQLPPDGHPIVLLADHQTTGGYPRLGELAAIDVPRAAQLVPGDEFRFAWIDRDDAQAKLVRRERDLAALRAAASRWSAA